jgi:hypothetical protein
MPGRECRSVDSRPCWTTRNDDGGWRRGGAVPRRPTRPATRLATNGSRARSAERSLPEPDPLRRDPRRGTRLCTRIRAFAGDDGALPTRAARKRTTTAGRDPSSGRSAVTSQPRRLATRKPPSQVETSAEASSFGSNASHAVVGSTPRAQAWVRVAAARQKKDAGGASLQGLLKQWDLERAARRAEPRDHPPIAGSEASVPRAAGEETLAQYLLTAAGGGRCRAPPERRETEVDQADSLAVEAGEEAQRAEP